MYKHMFYCILAVFMMTAVTSCEPEPGKPGTVVTIGSDGYWYLDGVKTLYMAGASNVPSIGADGYWYLDGVKTEYRAEGSVISIGTDGYWYINGIKTQYMAGGYAIPDEDRIIVAKFFERGNAEWMQERVEWAQQLGINQLLMFPDQVLRDGVADVISNSGIDLWLIAPFFYNDDNLSPVQIADFGREPRWGICDDGERAWEIYSPNSHPSGSWLRFVCPNDQEYIDYRINSLKPALRACDFTGISLDFMRQFVYWEGTYSYTNPNSLRNACFCDVCVQKFADMYGHTTDNPSSMPSSDRITNSAANNNLLDRFLALINERTLLIQEDVDGSNAQAIKEKTVEIASFIRANLFRQWTNYKCLTIDKNVEYILAEMRSEFPDLKSNIHAVPYTSNSYNGAVRSIAGQDFALLSGRLDMISPMTYDRLCQRPAYWINEVTADIVNVVGGRIPVVPTIEGRGDTDSDYQTSLINALKAPSSGVVIWRFESLTPERLAITESILKNK